MSAQTITLRKSLFGLDVDPTIVSSYQTEAAGLTVDGATYTDGSSNYKFDNAATFQGQYNGIMSFCTPTNDATLVSFIQTMQTNNPELDFFTFSQTISYGV